MPTSSGLNQIFRLLMNTHKSRDIAGKTIARQDTTQSQGIIYEAILASDNALIKRIFLSTRFLKVHVKGITTFRLCIYCEEKMIA